MSSNDSTRHRAPVVDSRDGDARNTHVVLVADGDSAVTDEIAGLLRGRYTVRTAHDGDALLQRLDGDVSVVLVDPALSDVSREAIVDRISTEEVTCQVAALTEEPSAEDRLCDAFDAYVRKPVVPPRLTATVDRLCHRVAYRSTLDRYYDLASALASLPPDDPQRDRLTERLRDLESDLDEEFETLDGPDAYEAALHELPDA